MAGEGRYGQVWHGSYQGEYVRWQVKVDTGRCGVARTKARMCEYVRRQVKVDTVRCGVARTKARMLPSRSSVHMQSQLGGVSVLFIAR